MTISKPATILISTVIAMAQPSMAAAQTVSNQTLRKLALTPSYQANLARLFARFPPDVFQRCPALVSKGSKVTVIRPVQFAADGMPVSGLWKQGFPVSGCGNDTTINFFFSAQANEQITSTTAAPGDTHADLALQRDAAAHAVVEARAKAPGCNDIHLRTTSFDGQLAQEVRKEPGNRPTDAVGWRETWTFFACGAMVKVPMTYIPDATGTLIVAAPALPLDH